MWMNIYDQVLYYELFMYFYVLQSSQNGSMEEIN
jgi:hypothetical protein